MSKVILLLAVLTAFTIGCERQSNLPSINPLIGDISFTEKFGREPSAADDEDLRIKTHLQYVANLLEIADVSALSPDLRETRRKILRSLYDYSIAGIFPRNYDQSGRAPCFIDKNGTICAVGYLIEQTAGREIAEEINSRHKYDELLAMDDALVDRWIASSGLTKEECAMIQPTYNHGLDKKINDVSVYYGRSFRLDDGDYHTAEVTCGRIRSGRRGRAVMKGIGFRADYFENDNFSAALRYFKLISKRSQFIYPYWGISPVLFRFAGETGFNFKPELGMLLTTGTTSMLALCINLTYGYDIPVYNEKSFLAGRHDLSAKIGVSARLDKVAQAFRKKEPDPEKKPDLPKEPPKE